MRNVLRLRFALALVKYFNVVKFFNAVGHYGHISFVHARDFLSVLIRGNKSLVTFMHFVAVHNYARLGTFDGYVHCKRRACAVAVNHGYGYRRVYANPARNNNNVQSVQIAVPVVFQRHSVVFVRRRKVVGVVLRVFYTQCPRRIVVGDSNVTEMLRFALFAVKAVKCVCAIGVNRARRKVGILDRSTVIGIALNFAKIAFDNIFRAVI